MSRKKIKYYSTNGCPGNLELKGRHVFKFPQEYEVYHILYKYFQFSILFV